MGFHGSVATLSSVTTPVHVLIKTHTGWKPGAAPTHHTMSLSVITRRQTQTMSRVSYASKSWNRTEPCNMRERPPSFQLISSVSSRKLDFPWARSPSVSLVPAGRMLLFQSEPPHQPSKPGQFSLVLRVQTLKLYFLRSSMIHPTECSPVVGPVLPSSSPNTSFTRLCFTTQQ